MYNEILEAGNHTAKELQRLQANEFGGPKRPSDSVAVTILKILTIIGGIFFAMVSASSLPPDMAFISITLIAIAVAAIVTGAEKIVAVFPRSIWIWNSHHPTTTVYYHPTPTPTRVWYNPTTWRRSPARGHSVYSTTSSHQPSPGGGSSRKSSSWFASSQSRTATTRTTSGIHAATGGGHHHSPYAGGTSNVAVGSRRHERNDVTAGGNVPVGGRRRR